LGQIVNFFYTLQGEAAGAQAISNFDTLLAPFVHYDRLGEKEVKQAFQEFVFNINIPTRVGFQTPFTNITLDINVPSTLKDLPVIVGGEEQKEKYGAFQREMDMINKAFAEVMMAGDAKGRVFTFPIPTYNITSDFDWDNPNLEMIWKMTGKYGIPYFSNFVNSDMSPEDARSMCCRLRLDNRELLKRGGGLFGANPLTGSIGVVTVNLPRIGYLSSTEDDFFEALHRVLALAQESLSIKRKVLERFTEKNLYPYSRFYLREIKEGAGLYWKNHFSTIGIIGMNEACLNLMGEDIGTEGGLNFSLRVMDFIRHTISDLQDQTGDLFNLEATPGEGTSYRLAMLDKGQFPQIICANERAYCGGAAPYYTNSTQLPVDYTDDLFETLKHQDDLQSKYTGGTVLHLYLGEEVSDVETVKNLIGKVVSRFRLPYFTLTPTFSVCPSHGYLNGEQTHCPTCHEETEVYSRVVGYLRPIKQWNKGKQAEYTERKVFKLQPVEDEFSKTGLGTNRVLAPERGLEEGPLEGVL
jgi:ribonucleoside-triphosphate reductase